MIKQVTDTSGDIAQRRGYRHGNLRQALLDAGIALARAGGPEAVVLREATRQAGVVPNAAYRHFASREDLLEAVRSHGLSLAAIAMENELDKLKEGMSPADRARGSLRAVGTGYLRFAQAEPGLFRTAFVHGKSVETTPDPAKAGHSGLNPFQLLSLALDRFVEAGILPRERRLGAEYLAWSAVHGLALLASDGPLKNATPAQRQIIEQRLLSMIENGL